MRYIGTESTYILANFTTGDTVTIDIYRLSDNTKVVDAAACTEIATTGRFKYAFSQSVSLKTEFLYIMSNGAEEQQGKIILGGWPDSILEDTNELQTNQGNWLTATGFATQNPPSQNLDDYKADVSALALESTAQAIKTKTDTISWSDVQEILKLTGHKVTKSGDIITIYESDGSTVWRRYDLSDGGRVEV